MPVRNTHRAGDLLGVGSPISRGESTPEPSPQSAGRGYPAIGADDQIRYVCSLFSATAEADLTAPSLGSVWVANAAKLPGFDVTRRTTGPRKPLFHGL